MKQPMHPEFRQLEYLLRHVIAHTRVAEHALPDIVSWEVAADEEEGDPVDQETGGDPALGPLEATELDLC